MEHDNDKVTTSAGEALVGAPETTKIKIHKDQDRVAGNSVEGMVNGLKFTVAIDQEISVPAHVLEALTGANVKFDVVGEDGGVSSSSTAPLTDTATRDKPNIDPLATGENGADEREVPMLGEGEGPGVGGAQAPAVEYDAQAAAKNADGQGAGADPSLAKPAPKKRAPRKPAAKK